MMVQKEERVLGVLEVVQWEAQRDTFLLVLVQKAQWRVLHLVGVQMAQKVEHLGYSKGWNLASLEEVGQVLYCSQQRFWQGSDQVVHLPTKIHQTFSRQDPSPRKGLEVAMGPQELGAEEPSATLLTAAATAAGAAAPAAPAARGSSWQIGRAHV